MLLPAGTLSPQSPRRRDALAENTYFPDLGGRRFGGMPRSAVQFRAFLSETAGLSTDHLAATIMTTISFGGMDASSMQSFRCMAASFSPSSPSPRHFSPRQILHSSVFHSRALVLRLSRRKYLSTDPQPARRARGKGACHRVADFVGGLSMGIQGTD